MGYPNYALLIIVVSLLTPLITGDEAPSSLVMAPHCSSKCGNVTIPYPFGIEEGCYYVDPDNPDLYPLMRLKCNYSTNPPKLVLGKKLLIPSISLKEGEITVNTYVSFNCYSQGQSVDNRVGWANLTPLTISSTKNKFVATGCDTYAWFTGYRFGKPYSTGCMTKCDYLDDVTDNHCNGVGCCDAAIPDGVTNITATVGSFDNHTFVPFNPCSVALPVANDAFMFLRKNLTLNTEFYLDNPLNPVVYNWGIGSRNCSQAKKQGNCLCKENTICSDLRPEQNGYRCKCKDGFTGNPYLPQGCQDIDECQGVNDCQNRNTVPTLMEVIHAYAQRATEEMARKLMLASLLQRLGLHQ